MPSIDSEVPVPSAPPKPNPRNNPIMFEIFQNVQFNVVQHKKYVKEMTKLYKKLDEESFRESFKNALYYLFSFGDTSANVDRVIQFVATFCASLDEDDEFLLYLVDMIFYAQCVHSQAVRYRSTQLLAAILTALGDEAALDENLCENLLTSQLKRLEDCRSAVRCRAAIALQRLQNPTEQDDPVTKAYRFSMSCDPHSSVRRAVVMAIAKCSRNVPFVLERLCDTDEAVRRAAFLYVSAMTVTHMRVKHRLLALKIGLTERCPRVRRVVEQVLIPSWLATYQGNVLHLLRAIRLDTKKDADDSKEVAAKLLDSLFKRLPISELVEWLPIDKNLRLIPAEKLNKESAWYWRHLACHLQRVGDEDTLDLVLPDLVVLAGYIRAIVESPCVTKDADPVPLHTRQCVLQELAAMLRVIVESPCVTKDADPVPLHTRQCVLQELAAMLRVYDAADPASRASLKELISDVLTGDYGPLERDVIRELVYALELAVPEVSPRIEMVGGLITTLREGGEPEQAPAAPPPPPVDSTEVKLQKVHLRVALNEAMEDEQNAVMAQNYALAAECKAKVEAIQKELDELLSRSAPPPPQTQQTVVSRKCDAQTLTKCLTILNCALDTPQVVTITPMLRIIFAELQEDVMENPEVVETALETVALYGMLDKEFVLEHKRFIFNNLLNISAVSVVCAVLRCILDLLCVHGVRVFDSEPDGSDTRTSTVRDDASVSSESAMSLPPLDNTVIEILLKLMDNTCEQYRQIIVEGLCKLLHLGHLESPAILTKLLILWFSPATADEDMLRQVIGVFFETFPVHVEGAQEQIQKATIPTLRAIAKAPSSSPLAEIDQEAIVKFIVSLTRVNYEMCDSQGEMGAVCVGHLARRPAAPEAGLVCRLLSLLSPPREGALAAALAHTLRDLTRKITDKQSCRNLTKYLGALEAYERASLNKISHTGITEGTMQEDSLAPLGRTINSLPQPIGRSTHVLVNETVEEEPDIDETSPPPPDSHICEGVEKCARQCDAGVGGSSKSERSSSGADTGSASNGAGLTDSGDDGSPDNIHKRPKDKKKKLALNRKTSKVDSNKCGKSNKKPGKRKSKEIEEHRDTGGVKRTRSQRSLVDVDIALSEKAEGAKSNGDERSGVSACPTADVDTSNVTIRRSVRTRSDSGSDTANTQGKRKKPAATKSKRAAERSQSGSERGSDRPFDDSDDSLHTIVYDQDFVQSVLNDSEEQEAVTTRSRCRGSLTVPETPDPSDESELDISPEPKLIDKRNGKKK